MRFFFGRHSTFFFGRFQVPTHDFNPLSLKLTVSPWNLAEPQQGK